MPRPRSRAVPGTSSEIGTAAWVCALPCAAVTVALVVLLGPPLSRILYPRALPVLPGVEHHPKPVESTRFLLTLLGPVLLVGSIAILSPRLRLARRPGIVLAGLAQLAAGAVVVASIAKQEEPGWSVAFFSVAQVAAAAAAAVLLAFAAQRGWLSRRHPETRPIRAVVVAIALLVTGIWFLWLLNTETTIFRYGNAYNTGWVTDETFAVLNGLTPLANYTAAYSSLWPFLFAPVLALLGKAILVWTTLMWALTVAMLLAAYDLLRRVTRSALGALALYLPLMSVVFLDAWRSAATLGAPPIAIYQQVPLRTAGPLLVAWLVARRLDRGRGATWPVVLAAGLVALNNTDYGIATLGATVAALAWARFPLSRQRVRQLAGSVVAGLAGAFALVAAMTLVRAGQLPDLLDTVKVARTFDLAGITAAPLPHILGLPLVVYLTYAAAIGVATVRAVQREPDRTLTGMLAWSGIYGFGASAYFMNNSVPLGIPTLFPAWGLSLALLAVVTVRQLAGRRASRPTAPALAALFGISLLATTLATPPPMLAPWSQVHRLATGLSTQPNNAEEPVAAPQNAEFREFVSSVPDGRGGFVLRSGAPVAFLSSTGHLIADAYGLKDVVPYVGESVFTAQQLDEAIQRLRAAGGSTVLVPPLILSRVSAALASRGFAVLTHSGPRAGVPGRSIPLSDVVAFEAEPTPSQLTKWVFMRAFAAGAPPPAARLR